MIAPVSIQWINEKVGEMYLTNVQMAEKIQALQAENEELKKPPEKEKVGPKAPKK